MIRRSGVLIMSAVVLIASVGGCKKAPEDGATPRTTPWPWESAVDQARPSLHGFIEDRLAGGDALTSSGLSLPDNDRWTQKHGQWAPGAYDSLTTWYVEPGNDPNALAREMLSRLRRYTQQPGDQAKADVYRFSLENPTIHYIDQLGAMASDSQMDFENLYALGRWLVTRSPDREPAKLGISILGWWPGRQDVETFLLMGRHEAFTLFAAVAIGNVVPEQADPAIWELAKTTRSWGRIQCVWRLGETKHDRIRRWLLREGFDNDVHIGYTAKTCVETGDLAGALKPGCDEEVFTAGGRMLSALVDPTGPGAHISTVPGGPELTLRWTEMATKRASTVRHLTSTLFIHKALTDPNHLSLAPREGGLSVEDRETVVGRCQAIRNQARWEPKIRRELTGDDANQAYIAAWAAEMTELRPFEEAMARLQRDPDDSAWWYWSSQWARAEQMDALLDLAGKHLPLKTICSGPTTSVGIGETTNDSYCLNSLLRALRRFPGKGAPLVKRALRGRIISVRWEAGRALAAWGKENWPEGTEEALRTAADREPHAETRKMLLRVLGGRPADPPAPTTQPADQSSGGGS